LARISSSEMFGAVIASSIVASHSMAPLKN
jgi:hypothetical protein